MPHRSVVARLWFAFSLMIIIVVVPLELALQSLLADFYARQVTDPLLYHSNHLAHMLAEKPETIREAAMVGRMVGGEVIVVNQQGRALPLPGGSQAPLPEQAVATALIGAPYRGRALGLNQQPLIVTAVPIPRQMGAVLLLAPAEPLEQTLVTGRRYLWLAGAGVFLFGSVLAFVLARQLLRPVLSMEKTIREISRGDLTARAEITSSDELGRLATGLNQMAVHLETFQNRRREFLANVAHELRTPLSYLRGYAQAFVEELITSPEDQKRYHQIIHEESLRLNRLVDDLMDLAQMEEGQMDFAFAPLNLRLPIMQAIETMRPMAKDKGVSLVVNIPQHFPTVLVDGERIRQVVFNLLDNGLRHTPDGGRISVTAVQETDGIIVRVADTGPGIEPDLLPLVFERFHKRHSTGKGLGLAIVRSIVRAHGGETSVDSTPGQGTTFWFRLPVEQNPPGTESNP